MICPDHAGFGRSDKPTDRGWYSYDRHVENAYRAARRPGPQTTPSSSVQDWGGPIGLRWAVENADRVGALVIMNTGIFTGRVSKGFMAWREFAEKNPDLPVGFVCRVGRRPSCRMTSSPPTRRPFPTVESKAGAAQFPLLVPISDDDRGAASDARGGGRAGRWEKPTLLAFSDTDPVLPYPKAGDRFIEMIPAAEEQVKIEDAAHFLQEDRGERIAEEILGFLKANGG